MIGGKLTAGYYNELAESNKISFTKQSFINLLTYGGVGAILGIDNLIKELIQDIESDLDECSVFYCGCNDEEKIKANREHIKNLICQLKEYV